MKLQKLSKALCGRMQVPNAEPNIRKHEMLSHQCDASEKQKMSSTAPKKQQFLQFLKLLLEFWRFLLFLQHLLIVLFDQNKF